MTNPSIRPDAAPGVGPPSPLKHCVDKSSSSSLFICDMLIFFWSSSALSFVTFSDSFDNDLEYNVHRSLRQTCANPCATNEPSGMETTSASTRVAIETISHNGTIEQIDASALTLKRFSGSFLAPSLQRILHRPGATSSVIICRLLYFPHYHRMAGWLIV